MCKRQQLQTGETYIFGNYFSLYLSICRLTTVLYIAFFFAKLTETFVHKKDWNSSPKQMQNVALNSLLSGVCFRTGGLKFLISWKVWFSLGMPKLICIPFHHIIWFRNPLSWLAFWLKFAALTQKRRKRLYDVENFTNKIVWMRLLAFGSHVTSRNRGSFSKQQRKPWDRGYFCETCRSDLSSILKIILFYCSYTIRSCRPVPLWLRKPFSPKSYFLDSIHAKAKL